MTVMMMVVVVLAVRVVFDRENVSFLRLLAVVFVAAVAAQSHAILTSFSSLVLIERESPSPLLRS